MSKIEDGVPAFPGMHRDPSKAPEYATIVGYHGMTLRDYFAAKAMQALVGADFRQDFTTEEDALYAYKMADAMLKAREQS